MNNVCSCCLLLYWNLLQCVKTLAVGFFFFFGLTGFHLFGSINVIHHNIRTKISCKIKCFTKITQKNNVGTSCFCVLPLSKFRTENTMYLIWWNTNNENFLCLYWTHPLNIQRWSQTVTVPKESSVMWTRNHEIYLKAWRCQWNWETQLTKIKTSPQWWSMLESASWSGLMSGPIVEI